MKELGVFSRFLDQACSDAARQHLRIDKIVEKQKLAKAIEWAGGLNESRQQMIEQASAAVKRVAILKSQTEQLFAPAGQALTQDVQGGLSELETFINETLAELQAMEPAFTEQEADTDPARIARVQALAEHWPQLAEKNTSALPIITRIKNLVDDAMCNL